MKTDNNEFRLEPNSTEMIPLDQYDRGVVQEALLWYAEKRVDDEDVEKHLEAVANHIFHYDRD